MKTLTVMHKLISSFTLCFLACFLIMTTAFAAISVEGVQGKWKNVQGGTFVQETGTKQIYWGGQNQTKSQKSSYRFDKPVPTIFPVAIGQPFILGTFTHFNHVIPIGSGIQSADLKVKISFNIDGTLLKNLPFTFTFNHNETPNIAGKCPAGSLSVCDDIVSFTNNHSQSTVITINGQQYTIDITGFMVNGNLVQQFLTQENKTNIAQLQAVITTVGVPEPSTYLMLGSTLAIALFAMRKKIQCRSN